MRRVLSVFALLLWLTSQLSASYAEATPRLVNDRVQVFERWDAGYAYLEVLPAGVDVNANLPMLVHIHGRGDQPRVPEGRFLGLEQPVRLILPRADAPHGQGYSWLSVSASRGESPELVRGLEEQRAGLANFLETITVLKPTVGKPIVTGFSQGGMLAFQLALHHPEVVSAAFPVAGYIPPSTFPSTRSEVQPVIRAMHGSADSVLLEPRTALGVRQLRHAGWLIEYRTFAGVDHETSGPMFNQLQDWVRRELRRVDPARSWVSSS